ncbi:hypothetical protein BD769DRAFT_1679021 [Suillus cothurnatus]|nr:hypothetical protein BD769DRAFT_1679021 [Suillus cothurnatus]
MPNRVDTGHSPPGDKSDFKADIDDDPTSPIDNVTLASETLLADVIVGADGCSSVVQQAIIGKNVSAATPYQSLFYKSTYSAERLSATDMVTMLGDLLERETKFHVKPLPHARIPIVKLSLDPSPGLPHGITCDIGFENRLALENTRLLMCYAMIDPTRVRTLVLFREFNCGLSTFFDDSTALTIVTFPVPTTGTQGVSEPHMAYQYGEDGDTIAIFEKMDNQLVPRTRLHGSEPDSRHDAWAASRRGSAAKADKTWSKGYTRKGAALHGARRYDEAVERVQVSNYWYNCVQTFSYTYGSPYNSRFYSCLPNILNNQYRHLDLHSIRPPPSSPLSLALSPLSPPLSLTLSLDLSPLLSSPLSPPSLCPAACLSSLCCRSIIRCSHFDQTFIGPHARHVPRSLHPPTTPLSDSGRFPLLLIVASGANTPSSGNTPSPSHVRLQSMLAFPMLKGSDACAGLKSLWASDRAQDAEFEDMVKKDFVGQGPYPTYILPSSSKTTPPPTTDPFPLPPTTLAPTPTYGHRYPSPPKPDFPPPTLPTSHHPHHQTRPSTASPPTPQGMEDCTTRIVSASSSPGIPKFHPPNSSYITPPTSLDTPLPSYSTSTSPASTVSPPTPPASSSPGIPKFPPPNSSYITPPTSSDTPLPSYSDCL